MHNKLNEWKYEWIKSQMYEKVKQQKEDYTKGEFMKQNSVLIENHDDLIYFFRASNKQVKDHHLLCLNSQWILKGTS